MLETVSQRFQGSCMMLMRRSGGDVIFLGSSFLVHSQGYLLTAARLVDDESDLVVVSPDAGTAFLPVTREEVAPVPVEVVARNIESDVALLRMQPDLQIHMPGQVLGAGDSDPTGSLLLSLGVPFGYYRVHGVAAAHSILASRVTSRSGANLIIFDRRVQFGDVGGPLLSGRDAVVIGVVGGVFDPVRIEGGGAPEGTAAVTSDLSYAASIEYGAALLAQVLSD